MSFLLAFLGFAALIILHEFGHFIVAKAVGMRVERFSLFFGPLLVRFRRGETDYGIGPIPLGGYVRITGMNPHEQLPEEQELGQLRDELERLRGAEAAGDPTRADAIQRQERELMARISEQEAKVEAVRQRAYYNQPVWKRIVVILAGPGMNLLIAFLLLFGIFWSIGVGATHAGKPVLAVASGQLQPPASTYLKPGDWILAVDGKSYPSPDQLTGQIRSHRCPGQLVAGCQAKTPVQLVVKRGRRRLSLSIYPRYDAKAGVMRIGFGITQGVRPIGPVTAAGQSVSQMWYVTHTTVSTVVRLFEPKVRRQLHGVVGGFTITQERFAYSTVDALYTLALISLSLAVINLFPFLPLDGGHVFWALAEKVRGRRIPVQVMERAGAVGVALIVIIFVIGLSNDISTLTGSGFSAK